MYGRTGSCLGRHGTLVAFLLDALNVVTGNLDRPGGAVFGSSPLGIERFAERFGLASYARRHSRVGGFPDVLGSFPATLMARRGQREPADLGGSGRNRTPGRYGPSQRRTRADRPVLGPAAASHGEREVVEDALGEDQVTTEFDAGLVLRASAGETHERR